MQNPKDDPKRPRDPEKYPEPDPNEPTETIPVGNPSKPQPAPQPPKK